LLIFSTDISAGDLPPLAKRIELVAGGGSGASCRRNWPRGGGVVAKPWPPLTGLLCFCERAPCFPKNAAAFLWTNRDIKCSIAREDKFVYWAYLIQKFFTVRFQIPKDFSTLVRFLGLNPIGILPWDCFALNSIVNIAYTQIS
jgi:hypothetical protein